VSGDFGAGERQFVQFLGGDHNAEKVDAGERQHQLPTGAQRPHDDCAAVRVLPSGHRRVHKRQKITPERVCFDSDGTG